MLNKISYLLDDKGISIRQLSKDLDLSYSHAYKIVNRKDLSKVQAGTLVSIANYLEVEFDELYKGEPGMFEKLLQIAKKEVQEEMDLVGYIDNSDYTERFADQLAYKLASEALKDEDETEVEELRDDLLEEINEYMKLTYNLDYKVNERGDYQGCYYENKDGLEKWRAFFEE